MRSSRSNGRGGSPWAVACLVAVLLMAGCAAGPFYVPDESRPNVFLAFGRPGTGYHVLGSATDGSGVNATHMGVSVDLSDLHDVGTVVAAGYDGNDRRVFIKLRDFEGSRPYQDGGVATDLALHGATGRGDPWLPTVHALAAAWGNATIMVEAEPYPNPVTMGPYWAAELLVLRDAVRDEATQAILRADGTGPYDPDRPSDAKLARDRPQILLVLRSHTVDGAFDLPVMSGFQAGQGTPITDAAYLQNHDLFNEAYGAEGTFRVQLSTASPTGLAQTDLTFTFRSPSGAEMASARLGGGTGPSDEAVVTFPMHEFGYYRVTVAGTAVAVSYRVDAAFTIDGPVILQYWWDSALLDQAARDQIWQWRRVEEFAAYGGEPPPEPGDPIPRGVADPQPPGINLVVVALGVAATLVTGLLVVKLVLDSRTGRRFQDKFRKRE